MKIETYFLRYAFPCAGIILQRKEISLEKFDELKKIAANDEPVSRKDLEKIFFRAFREIELLAKEKNKHKWDFEIIQDYFHNKHNKIINEGKSVYKYWPEAMRELSKVFKAKVVGKKDNVLIVEYDNGKEMKTRNVVNDFVPDAEIGDFVMIHYGYAAEKVV